MGTKEECAVSRCGCCAFMSQATADDFGELRCRLRFSVCSPLHAAAARGDAETARELLKAGSPVDAVDELCNTPLILAAACGSEETVQLLLKNGASVSERNLLGLTPLHACCCRPGTDSLGVLQLLLSAGADAAALTLPADEELEALAGDTSLALAAQHAFPSAGAVPFVMALLATAGTDPLQPSAHSGTSALEFACAAGDVEVMRLLLQAAPASKWYKHEAGFNIGYCLRLAVAYGCVEVVGFLLDPPPEFHAILTQTAIPEPNSVLLPDEGSSLTAAEASFQVACAESTDVFEPVFLEACLHDAIRLGSLDIVRLLVAAGSNGTCYSTTPRLFQLYKEHMRDLGFGGRFPLLHKLDSLRNLWDTPLTLALSTEADDIAVWLLKRTMPRPIPDSHNRTALHWATLKGKLYLLRRLLDSGLYREEVEGSRAIDARDADGWSALSIALHYRDTSAAELLLKHGANPDAKIYTKSGAYMTPVHKAILMEDEQASAQILKIVLQYGALVDALALELAERCNPEALALLRCCCKTVGCCGARPG